LDLLIHIIFLITNDTGEITTDGLSNLIYTYEYNYIIEAVGYFILLHIFYLISMSFL